MARKRKRPHQEAAGPEQQLAQEFAEQLLAAHGGDPIAAWQSLNAPGGLLDSLQDRSGGPAVAGSAAGTVLGGDALGAFGGFGTSDAFSSDVAGGVGGPGAAGGRSVAWPAWPREPERRFILPEPPAQVRLFRVRVDIDDAKPPIWRRLELAGDLTLSEVHIVLQAAFGWFGYHLHSFVPQVDGVRDRRVRPFLNEGTVEFCDDRLPEESQVRFDQVVEAPGDRLFYEYDFGDSWEHTLTVEAVSEYAEGAPRARCLAGRRAGPPEDAGGIWRYNAIVAALGGDDRRRTSPEAKSNGPKSNEAAMDEEELEEIRDWLGEDFDPADAGLDEIDLEDLLSTVTRTRDVAPQLVGNPRLCPAFAELVERSDTAGVLHAVASLVLDAGLDLRVEPPGAARAAVFAGITPQEAEEAVAPWRTFLRAIGPDGAELTSAGYLRPAVVETLFHELGLDRTWIGKGNREDLTPDVARLRRVATSLGLVRKAKGRLLPTKAAATARDPIRLWRIVADNLTRGKQAYERQAAVIALLVAAADSSGADDERAVPAEEMFTALAPELMGALGWSVGGGPIEGWAVLQWSETVWTTLRRSGCIDTSGFVSAAGRRLARAALLAP